MVPFAQRIRTLLTAPFIVVGLSLAIAALGCGVEHPPTSSDTDAVGPSSPDGKVYLVFSPQSPVAAKAMDDDDDDDGDWLSTSKVAEPDEKTRLKIEDDDLSLKLVIPEGAVTEAVRIRMAVRPAPLSLLVVELGPSPYWFVEEAPSPYLEIELDAELVDMDPSTLRALVVSDDGQIGETNIISIETHGDDDDDGDDGDDDGDDDDGDDDDDDDDGSASFESVTIVIEVPHFSRYGLRNSSYAL